MESWQFPATAPILPPHNPHTRQRTDPPTFLNGRQEQEKIQKEKHRLVSSLPCFSQMLEGLHCEGGWFCEVPEVVLRSVGVSRSRSEWT